MTSLLLGPRVIIALDYDCLEPMRALVKKLSPALCRLKIGNIMFTRYGPALIRELTQEGFEIFLDLKYHDIPQTVVESCCAAAELGVWMMNMHVASGRTALCSVKTALAKMGYSGLLTGVTVLTSLDAQDLRDIHPLNESVGQEIVCHTVLQRALLAQQCGLDGVVCSPQEVSLLREKCGPHFILVTPGIRWDFPQDDQKRTVNPADAVRQGASYLVIGRPITQALDPLSALERAIHSVHSVSV